jgi:hypothetical protein
MSSRVSIATVVTASTLKEFLVLRYSFEHFHPEAYHWFVRCDQATEEQIRAFRNTNAISFCERWEEPVTSESRAILDQKMNAIADAWESDNSGSVVFLAPDLIFTSQCFPDLLRHETDLILTPNYFPWALRELSPYFGYFSSEFVLTRSSRFHEAWRSAYQSAPWKFSDQACLSEVATAFSVTLLGTEANIGSWRSERTNSFFFKSIPAECSFLRAPCFRRLVTSEDWRDRMFALHCLRFLKSSVTPQHNAIYEFIISLDDSTWYEASFRLLA